MMFDNGVLREKKLAMYPSESKDWTRALELDMPLIVEELKAQLSFVKKLVEFISFIRARSTGQ